MTRIHSPSILKISSLFACFFLVHAAPNGSGSQPPLNLNPTEPQGSRSGLTINIAPPNSTTFATGTNVSLNCHRGARGHIWWSKDDKNLTDKSYEGFGRDFDIKNARIEDTGNYTCVAMKEDKSIIQETIEIKIEDPVIPSSQEEVRARLGASIILSCPISRNHLENYGWHKIGYPNKIQKQVENLAGRSKFNESHSRLTLNFTKVTHEDNGTYECSFTKAYNNETVTSQRILIVTDVPEVKIIIAKAVGPGQVYLNWTVNAHNEPVNHYLIESYRANDNDTWHSEKIDVENSSLLLENLEKETMYRFRITATNSVGKSTPAFSEYIMTSGKDYNFIPKISVADTTDVSIKIALESPPPELTKDDYYYEINVTEGEEENSTVTDLNSEYFTVPNLKPGTNYKIKVAACNCHTKKCFGWSEEQKVQTLDESGKSLSTGLHPAGINVAATMIVSLYSLIKYVLT